MNREVTPEAVHLWRIPRSYIMVLRALLICGFLSVVIVFSNYPDRCSDYYAARDKRIAGHVLEVHNGRYGKYIVLNSISGSYVMESAFVFSSDLINMAMVGDSLYKGSGADSGVIIREKERYSVVFLDYPPGCKEKYERESRPK